MSIRLHIVCIACLSMLVVAVMMHLNPAGTSPEIAGRLNAYRRVEQAATIIRKSVSNEVFQIKSCGWIYDELEKNGVHNARKYISICTLGTCSNLFCISCAYQRSSVGYFAEKVVFVDGCGIWESGVWYREDKGNGLKYQDEMRECCAEMPIRSDGSHTN